MSERDSTTTDQPDENNPPDRPRSSFLDAIGGFGETAGTVAGAGLVAATDLASQLTGAIDEAVREALEPGRDVEHGDDEEPRDSRNLS